MIQKNSRSIGRLGGAFLVLIVSGFLAGPVFADSVCNGVSQDGPTRSSLGNASTWSNLRGSDGSLKKESQRLIEETEKAQSTEKAPALVCPDNCKVQNVPTVVFRSIPNKFLAGYDDEATCKALYEKTKRSPLVYGGKVFSSVEELNSWFGDFSQGKGNEGSDLYSKCPGSCSPQYTNLIERKNGKYTLESIVVCGPARDKSDNQYKLTAANRWRCGI